MTQIFKGSGDCAVALTLIEQLAAKAIKAKPDFEVIRLGILRPQSAMFPPDLSSCESAWDAVVIELRRAFKSRILPY
jgi:hypothetical protein